MTSSQPWFQLCSAAYNLWAGRYFYPVWWIPVPRLEGGGFNQVGFWTCNTCCDVDLVFGGFFFLHILSGRLTVIFCCLVKLPRGTCRFWSPTGHPFDKRQGPMINSIAPEKGQCVKNEKRKCKYFIKSLSCCNSYCTCVCKSKILIQLLI